MIENYLHVILAYKALPICSIAELIFKIFDNHNISINLQLDNFKYSVFNRQIFNKYLKISFKKLNCTREKIIAPHFQVFQDCFTSRCPLFVRANCPFLLYVCTLTSHKLSRYAQTFYQSKSSPHTRCAMRKQRFSKI